MDAERVFVPQTHIPEWAEKTLAKPEAFPIALHEVLLQFYGQWEALHKIPNEKHNRKKQEEAAQELTATAHMLRRMMGESQIRLKNG